MKGANIIFEDLKTFNLIKQERRSNVRQVALNFEQSKTYDSICFMASTWLLDLGMGGGVIGAATVLGVLFTVEWFQKIAHVIT